MRIYIASSWKNAGLVANLASLLRLWGYQVYAFCEEERGHFVFDARDWQGKDLSKMTAREMYHHPAATKAFEVDKAGCDWAETVLLLNPAGRSSHLEAGYAVGQGKHLIVIGEPHPGEFDVMYGFADDVVETPEDLHSALINLEKP